jgi:long-chain acyl-CoA synthetase
MVPAMEIRDTLPRQFLWSVETYGRPDAFRHKQGGAWVNVSHREMLERVHTLALGLRDLNLAKTDRVALLSENRIEWAVTDLAIQLAGGVTVPVYPTLIPSQVEYILRDSDARVIFVSTKAQAEKIAAMRGRLPLLERVIAFDADAAGGDVDAFEDIVRRGRVRGGNPPAEEMAAQMAPTDWASVIYTSGTTGEPKGVILTHRNFMSNVDMCLEAFRLGPDDVYMSVLPLSHVFERTAGFYTMMTAGVQIAYAEAIELAMNNITEVRPTVVCFVPRIYEKFYEAVFDKVSKGSIVQRRLFHWGVHVGAAAVNARLATGRRSPLLQLQHRIALALVFRKLRHRVGGRMRFFVSGSAPLSRKIIEFFHGAGLPVLEGYGLTETAPVVTVNTLEHIRLGSVGRPVHGVEIRIESDGEILVRGDNVMQGYLKKPDDTAASIVNGWFHTGDIGHLDDDGFLYITDRKKDLIATAGGKKVAPQPIEVLLKQNHFVAEAMLVGNRRPYITLLVVPNFARLTAWAATHHRRSLERRELLALPEVQKIYQEIIDRVNETLAQFERIKSFTLLDVELTTASGDLTPTLKVRRKIVEEHFHEQIDRMYQVGGGGRA